MAFPPIFLIFLCGYTLPPFTSNLIRTKHVFIVPTDAHNYKIIGMLKTIKIQTIAPIVEILIFFNISMIL